MGSLKSFLLVLLCTTSAFSLPSLEADERIAPVINSDGIDGYSIATIQAVDSDTNEERGQTKRDIEAFAENPLSEKRRVSLLLSSGERLRLTLNKCEIDTSETTFSVLTEEGLRQKTMKPRDCFFGGELEGEEGYVNLAMCDGQVMGSINTAKRSYEIHSLSGASARSSADEIENVLVTWREGQWEEESLMNDEIEIPEDALEAEDDDGNSHRSVTDRQVTIEIADFVDKAYIEDLGKNLGKRTDEEINDFIRFRWCKAQQALSDTSKIGWNITLKLVNVTLWRQNPSWYRAYAIDRVLDRLYKFCPVAGKETNFDHAALHTSQVQRNGVAGRGYMSGTCRPAKKCTALKAIDYRSNTEVHELGHTLGLHHDNKMSGCVGRGFMGPVKSSNHEFIDCYKERLDKFFRRSDKGCVYIQNAN